MYAVVARTDADRRTFLGLIAGEKAAAVEQWLDDDRDPPYTLAYDDVPTLLLDSTAFLETRSHWITSYCRMDKTPPSWTPSWDHSVDIQSPVFRHVTMTILEEPIYRCVGFNRDLQPQLLRVPHHGDPQYHLLRPLRLLASVIKIADVGPRLRHRLQVYRATRVPRPPRDDSPPPKWYHMDGDDPTQDGEDEAETGE